MILDDVFIQEYQKKLQATASLCQRFIKDFSGHPYKASLLKDTIRESLKEVSGHQSSLPGVKTSEDIIRQLNTFHVNLAKENEGKYRDPKNMNALLQEISDFTTKLSDNVDKITE